MSPRRLAAILAADVAGYSRLMGVDEEGTLDGLKAHRRELLDPKIAEHRGRIVKTTGDGMLVEFASAVDAARCAVEVQRDMAGRNAGVAPDKRIDLRIGIHVGDIIIDGDDIFGDGVNIAARLEGIAEPGGICISDDAQRQILGKVEVAFDDLGEQTLKNIARPMRTYRMRAAADAVAQATTTALALPDKPSIAVLPFQNMSGDPEQEYFADGMVEDIITALSRFKSLFVIARNSSFTYKGRAVDIKQVGRELGVRYVLEGSVRKAAGRVRITGQLIDSETGNHLWADRFDGSLEDIFDLQDQMTSSVVGAIAPRIDQAEMERARRKPVEKLDAYDCFLRGLPCARVITRESQDEALRLFYQAIDLDPHFSTPYGLAARCYVLRKQQSWIIDKDREEAETRRLAQCVTDIGRDDALALCCTGFSLFRVCEEYDTGAALVDQSLLINPNLAAGWTNRGAIRLFLGQHEAAIEQLGRALRLNPLDPETYWSEGPMAYAYLLLGRYDEALNWAAKALSHQPGWAVAIRASIAANVLAGNIEEARRVMVSMRQHDPGEGVSKLRGYLPYHRPEDIERIVEALRLAGLPE